MEFKKLKRLVKTRENFQQLIDRLIIGVTEDKPFGDRMFTQRDGFVVGLFYCNANYIRIMITTDEYLPNASDNTIQQLQEIMIWMMRNEDNLVTLFKAKEYEKN